MLLARRAGAFPSLPAWAWLLAAAFGGPLVFAVRVGARFRSMRARAAAVGAVLPPALEGREPGNFDVLRGILDAFKNGYPCECADGSGVRAGWCAG